MNRGIDLSTKPNLPAEIFRGFDALDRESKLAAAAAAVAAFVTRP